MADKSVVRHITLIAIILVGMSAYIVWRMRDVAPKNPDESLGAVPGESLATGVVTAEEINIPDLPGMDDDDSGEDADSSEAPTTSATIDVPSRPGSKVDGAGSDIAGNPGQEAIAEKVEDYRKEAALDVPPPPAVYLTGNDPAGNNPRPANITIESSAANNADDAFYLVKSKDTLSSISAHHYGSASHWRKIYEANKNIIDDPNRLRLGTRLAIPGVTPAKEKSEVNVPAPAERKVVHVVKKGESLPLIAAKYYFDSSSRGISRIRTIDGKELSPGTTISEGMRLLILINEETKLQDGPNSESGYIIKSNDTLFGIAKKAYGSGGKWKLIYDANRDKIPNPDRLVVGTKIIIPDRNK